MKYENKNQDSDWAKDVPDRRFRGPYEDYGWERDTSVLPEFRDPSVHLNPEEQREVERWRRQQGQGRRMERRGETNRYGNREISDHERSDASDWSGATGGYFPGSDPNNQRSFSEDYYSERGDWMTSGPYTGMGPSGYRRADDRIQEDVCERLTQHGQIDARKINVEVHEGVVTLQGMVDSRRTKRLIEDTLDSIPGVQDIQNGLRIQQSQED